MAAPVVRDERGRFKAARHPCTVGKAKAKAGKPGKVNGTATKKTAVKTIKSAAAAKKVKARRHKAAVKAAKTRAVEAKAAAKTSGRAKAAAAKPC